MYAVGLTFSFTVQIAFPVVPQVVTYVNESDTLNLDCSKVATVSDGAVTLLGRSWLDPNGNTIATTAITSLPSVNRTAAGNYTCITKLVSNVNGVSNVTASTMVVVYCRCPPWGWGHVPHVPLAPLRPSHYTVPTAHSLCGPRSNHPTDLYLWWSPQSYHHMDLSQWKYYSLPVPLLGPDHQHLHIPHHITCWGRGQWNLHMQSI